jgi:hypothetical protein
MRHLKLLITLSMVIFLSNCADEDAATAAAYECKLESFTFDGNTQATTCATLPTSIKAVVEDVVVPTGETLTIYFFGTDGSSGYTVAFTPTSVSADLVDGATATSASKSFTTAQSVCIEIHDITSDQHIQIFDGEACTGTAIVDHEDPAGTAATVREVRYNGSTNGATVTLAELHITQDATDHVH